MEKGRVNKQQKLNIQFCHTERSFLFKMKQLTCTDSFCQAGRKQEARYLNKLPCSPWLSLGFIQTQAFSKASALRLALCCLSISTYCFIISPYSTLFLSQPSLPCLLPSPLTKLEHINNAGFHSARFLLLAERGMSSLLIAEDLFSFAISASKLV